MHKAQRRWSLGMTRRYAASHTLRSPDLSDADNERIFGKCANRSGHGHDYGIEFVVSADALTDDTVMGRGELAALIDAHVAPRFAYQNLNESFGEDFITSGENLARAVWELLAPRLSGNVRLTIRLQETRKNSFAYDGARDARESAT